MNPYGRIFRSLNEAGVRYLVVGGVAMNLLGYPRFTGDIDILLALDKRNLAAMKKLMRSMGYEPRVPVALEELDEEERMLALMKEKNLFALTFMNPREPQFNIDIVIGESLRFSKFQKHATTVEVWNISVPVVSIDDLIAMKKSTGRQKDIDDVRILLELKGQ